jgi:hypothetical protein
MPPARHLSCQLCVAASVLVLFPSNQIRMSVTSGDAALSERKGKGQPAEATLVLCENGR